MTTLIIHIAELDDNLVQFTAELQGVEVGQGRLRRLNRHLYWSSALQVHEQYRGQGIAGTMHRAKVQYVREHNGAAIVASVRDDNVAQHRSMGKLGGWTLIQRVTPEVCLWVYHLESTHGT